MAENFVTTYKHSCEYGCHLRRIDVYRVLILSLVNTCNLDMTTDKRELCSLIVEERGPWLHDIDEMWGIVKSVRRHFSNYLLPDRRNIVFCTFHSSVGRPEENLLHTQ